MISSYKITTQQQQTIQRQLNTCHLNRVKSSNSNSIRNISSTLDFNTSITKNYTLLESKQYKMTTLAADLTKAAVASAPANAKTMGKPPMEAVVVNSIIYSKPSFCSIAVDLDNVPSSTTGDNKSAMAKPKTGNCSNNSVFHNEIDSKSGCWANFSVPPPSADAKVYRMCTTINGSIHHQISELFDNLLASAEFFSADDNNEHDDDSLIEFAYRDDDNLVVGGDLDNEDDDDEDEEEEDYPDDEDDYDGNLFDDYDDDDDNDVVDFCYEYPIEPAPKLNCDKKKKVRFNTKPTVHVMHAWNYAYRTARKGEWEMYARDRERFKLRIQRMASTLNPILKREHRQKIYENRFVNLFDNNVQDNDQCQQTDNLAEEIAAAKTEVSTEKSTNESKKSHQKKKRRKRRYCKMGNKHYF